MTAAVPDPRFRDQLAEALWRRAAGPDAPPLSEANESAQRFCRADADALMPTIAAEVEARVQAAAYQWDERDELLRQRMAEAAYRNGWRDGQKVAALASPAPALDAEEGP